jgi:hypothetical protein
MASEVDDPARYQRLPQHQEIGGDRSMNNERRACLLNIVEKLTAFKDEVFEVQDEEQTAYENMPEPLQGTERGQASEQAASDLDDAVNALQETIVSSTRALSIDG